MPASQALVLNTLPPFWLRLLRRVRRLGGRSKMPLPQEERKRIPAKVLALQELPSSRRTPVRVQLTLEFLPYPGTNAPWQEDYTLRADQVDRRVVVVGQTVLVEYREGSPGRFQVLRIVRPLTSSREEAEER